MNLHPHTISGPTYPNMIWDMPTPLAQAALLSHVSMPGVNVYIWSSPILHGKSPGLCEYPTGMFLEAHPMMGL